MGRRSAACTTRQVWPVWAGAGRCCLTLQHTWSSGLEGLRPSSVIPLREVRRGCSGRVGTAFCSAMSLREMRRGCSAWPSCHCLLQRHAAPRNAAGLFCLAALLAARRRRRAFAARDVRDGAAGSNAASPAASRVPSAAVERVLGIVAGARPGSTAWCAKPGQSKRRHCGAAGMAKRCRRKPSGLPKLARSHVGSGRKATGQWGQVGLCVVQSTAAAGLERRPRGGGGGGEETLPRQALLLSRLRALLPRSQWTAFITSSTWLENFCGFRVPNVWRSRGGAPGGLAAVNYGRDGVARMQQSGCSSWRARAPFPPAQLMLLTCSIALHRTRLPCRGGQRADEGVCESWPGRRRRVASEASPLSDAARHGSSPGAATLTAGSTGREGCCRHLVGKRAQGLDRWHSEARPGGVRGDE